MRTRWSLAEKCVEPWTVMPDDAKVLAIGTPNPKRGLSKEDTAALVREGLPASAPAHHKGETCSRLGTSTSRSGTTRS
jgi:hypothetical protein